MLHKFMKYIVDTENLKYIEYIIITSKILISNIFSKAILHLEIACSKQIFFNNHVFVLFTSMVC